MEWLDSPLSLHPIDIKETPTSQQNMNGVVGGLNRRGTIYKRGGESMSMSRMDKAWRHTMMGIFPITNLTWMYGGWQDVCLGCLPSPPKAFSAQTGYYHGDSPQLSGVFEAMPEYYQER